MDIEIKKQ